MSVGFKPRESKDYELEQLREAWRSLNSLLRSLNDAEVCLKSLDLHQTAEHLKVAKWGIDQVKKRIRNAGQARKEKH
jgi:hypothetical protein